MSAARARRSSPGPAPPPLRCPLFAHRLQPLCPPHCSCPNLTRSPLRRYFAQFVTSEARISTDQLISLRQKFTAEAPDGSVAQADIYTIATAGVEDGDGPGIPSSAVDKVLQ